MIAADLTQALEAFERAETMLYGSASSLELAGPDSADPLTITQLRLSAILAGMLADELRLILADLRRC